MIVEKLKEHVKIQNGNVIDIIPIDDANDQYKVIKERTKNFTEMYLLSESEVLKDYILQIDYRLALQELGLGGGI